MNTFAVIFAIIIACCSVYALTKDTQVGEPAFEILEGNCSRALKRDRIFFDHVELSAIPLYVRSHDVSMISQFLKTIETIPISS